MDRLGPPWQYIEPKIAAILIILFIAFFVNKFFKYRHEIKIARIQSGNPDPMQTLAGAFLVFRRGIVLVCLGLNVIVAAIVKHPVPLAFLPFTLGMAYLIIYFLHIKGVFKLFPENGKKQTAAKAE